MKDIKHYQEFDKIQIMLHKLLLSSSMLSNIGLLQGKTGLAFFFMHYYRQTGNALYEDVAGELLDEVTEKLQKNLPITFDSGLSGIGWTVDYFIAKGFVEGDSLEICEDIDCRIMETDPRRLTDYSLENGIGGILLYVLAHSKIVYSQHKKRAFDSCYLQDLYTACINIRFSKEIPSEIAKLMDAYLLFYTNNILPDESIWDESVVVQEIPNFDHKKLNGYPLGIKKGIAGVLFKKCCLQNTSL